jgi:hypothetical protein
VQFAHQKRLPAFYPPADFERLVAVREGPAEFELRHHLPRPAKRSRRSAQAGEGSNVSVAPNGNAMRG